MAKEMQVGDMSVSLSYSSQQIAKLNFVQSRTIYFEELKTTLIMICFLIKAVSLLRKTKHSKIRIFKSNVENTI